MNSSYPDKANTPEKPAPSASQPVTPTAKKSTEQLPQTGNDHRESNLAVLGLAMASLTGFAVKKCRHNK